MKFGVGSGLEGGEAAVQAEKTTLWKGQRRWGRDETLVWFKSNPPESFLGC